MNFNTAYNKPNSFFNGKKAILTIQLKNMNNEVIDSNSQVTINRRAHGLKIFFDIVSESGVYLNYVSYEFLNLEI